MFIYSTSGISPGWSFESLVVLNQLDKLPPSRKFLGCDNVTFGRQSRPSFRYSAIKWSVTLLSLPHNVLETLQARPLGISRITFIT